MSIVTRQVLVPAEPGDTWNVVTHDVAGWLADEGCIELRPGGEGWVREDGRLRHVITELVEAQRCLTFRWWPVDAEGVGPATRVTLELLRDTTSGDEDQAPATRVVVVEAPAAPALPPTGPLALAAVA
ncbi:MAG: hypothetical protein M3493_03535 [Actinomycetota bacterium]|jgi:hypothetical protein|nr:hypothetical protein [Actinomycetota bacterium]